MHNLKDDNEVSLAFLLTLPGINDLEYGTSYV